MKDKKSNKKKDDLEWVPLLPFHKLHQVELTEGYEQDEKIV